MKFFYPPPVKLVVGLLGSSLEVLKETQKLLEANFSVITLTSSPKRFDEFSTYYCEEMGDEIWRQFVCFKELVASEELASLKIKTNELEERGMRQDCRTVNIDPAILGLEKLVVPTTKPGSQRIYLRDGIYAQIMLTFEKNSFQPVALTYADYKWPESIAFFNEVRNEYKKSLFNSKLETQNSKLESSWQTSNPLKDYGTI